MHQYLPFRSLAAISGGLILASLTGCGTALAPTEHSGGHIGPTASAPASAGTIPAIVNPAPLVPPPASSDQGQQLYTVVAQDIPVRDILFNMARDAAINVDVDPNVTGVITLNAIDQSLPQILERISHQANIRWNFDASGNLVIKPDAPYWGTYQIDYVNVQRNSSTSTDVSTAIVSNVAAAAGGGGGGNRTGGGNNNSTSSLSQSTANNFWATLSSNLAGLLGQTASTGATTGAQTSSNIVINAESGVVSINATSKQHEEIAKFIKNVTTRSLYQVLIEATVVEVTLGDKFQSGVDWDTLQRNNGQVNFIQRSLGANLANAPTNILTIDRSNTADAITATIALLSQFGELRVLSSPKIMALNNQAAMLRVVDNVVYFTIDVQPGLPPSNSSTGTAPVYTSSVHTVPVGLVMSVTPQIGADDQVTLNVRPTISRIVRYVNDPNPILADADVTNSVPETQVREMESVLKVYSGQTAVLGGLMQDSLSKDTDGLPGLSRLPGIRNLFGYRSENASKTELIIFIRPVVVKDASVDGDLKNFEQYLPTKPLEEESAAINTKMVPDVLKGKIK